MTDSLVCMCACVRLCIHTLYVTVNEKRDHSAQNVHSSYINASRSACLLMLVLSYLVETRTVTCAFHAFGGEPGT